jgi:uncharacterized membrane protein (Fun14 family)
MGTSGFSAGQVLRKAADLAHLLVWAFFLSYLSLSTYGRLSVDGPDLRPLFLGPYSGHFYMAFWMTLFGVPVLTAVVAVHIARTSKIFYAETLVTAAAWCMLLYNLSFLRG